MLDEKYTEPNKQQKGVKDAVRTKWPLKTIQAAKPFSLTSRRFMDFTNKLQNCHLYLTRISDVEDQRIY